MNERLCFPYKDDTGNILEFANDIERIYSRMEDDVSKDIFSNRLLYSLTGDQICLKNILLHTPGGKKLDALLHKEGKIIYVYGSGIRGKRLVELFPDVCWGGFIDRNKSLEKYHNIEILDLRQFLERYVPGMTVIVSNMMEAEEIADSLRQKGIAPEDIYTLNSYDKENVKDIYFPPGEIKLPIRKDKSFVDIGCYDGKDSLQYLKWSGNKEAKIYAFEPDIRNYEICKENLNLYPNIELFNIGLSDHEEEVGVMGEGEMSYLGIGSERKVWTKRLDNILGNKFVGFMKMDVEGYEEHALRGAEEIIRSQRPVLAVSVYHKKSDIWRIPKLLLEYYGGYRFYMRHYSVANGDTVLYAVDV